MEKIRCFLAIEIPDDIKKKIEKIKEELPKEGIKPVALENQHITLKFLGWLSTEKLEQMKKKLEEIQFVPFSVTVKGIGVFPNEKNVRVIWIGCESEKKELEALAEKINGALAKDFEKEEFVGHLTIARVKKRESMKAFMKDFLQKHKDENFGSFVCNSFQLRQSVLQRSGPVYSTIALFYTDSNSPKSSMSVTGLNEVKTRWPPNARILY